MKNWKRILAAAGTAALLVSNLGAVSQVTFAAEETSITEDLTTNIEEIPVEEPVATESVDPEEQPVAEPTETDGQPATDSMEEEAPGDEGTAAGTTETPVAPALAELTAGDAPADSSVDAGTSSTEATAPVGENVVMPAEGTEEETATEENQEQPTQSAEADKDESIADKTAKAEGLADGTTEAPEGDVDPGATEPAQESKTDNTLVEYQPDKPIDGIEIKAYAATGVIPEGSRLVTTLIENKKELNDVADELDRSDAVEEYDGFVALDVHFVDADGQEIQPEDGEVQVTFAFDDLPAEVDKQSVAVQHFDETNGLEVVTVADTTSDPDTGDVIVEETAGDDSSITMTAAFEVESFSTFTITWKEGNTSCFDITVHYVDLDGEEIKGTETEEISIDGSSEPIVFSTYSTTLDSSIREAYTYREARYGAYDGKTITSVETSEESRWFGIYKEKNLVFMNGDETSQTLTWNNLNNQVRTADIYLVFEKSSTDPGTITNKQELSRSKTVVKNADGTYDLTLAVTGAVGTKENQTLIDVVLIVDTSTSMNWNLNGDNPKRSEQSRIAIARSAATTLVNSLSDDGIDARFNVVTFGGNDSQLSLSGWLDKSSILTTINNIKTVSDSNAAGTNYESAMVGGIDALKSVRSNAKKVVIFLTDGEPNKINNWYKWENPSNEICINTAENKSRDITCDAFYAIGIGSSFENKGGNEQYTVTNLKKLCGQVSGYKGPTASVKEYKVATKSGELDKIFANIAKQTTTLLTTNVVITDVLSDNVDLVQGATIKVVVTDKDRHSTETDTVIGTQNSDGSVTMKATENNTTASTLSVRYDAASKTITSSFPADYILEPDYTYGIKTTIEPTEAAYEAYRSNDEQYTNSGGVGTGDYSGKDGFYSNDKATVDYKWNDEQQPTVNFDKPVIRLDPGTLSITKTFVGDLTDEQITSLVNKITFTVNLEWTVDGRDKTNQNDAHLPVNVPLSMFKTEDNKTFTYTYSEGLTPGTTYTVTESDANLVDYDLDTTPVATASGKVQQTGTVSKGETATAAFTNSYTPSVGNLKVTMQVQGSTSYVDPNAKYNVVITVPGAAGKSYTAKDKNGDDVTVTFNTDGEHTASLADGDSLEIHGLPKNAQYTVEETRASGTDKGFKVTHNGREQAATGTIVKQETQIVAVVNTIKVVNTGVDLGDDMFLGIVLAVDAMVAMFLAYGFVKRRIRQ